MDVHNIAKGANWDDEIDLALAECDVVVGVVSKTSVESNAVQDEWAYAQQENKLQLAYIEQCEIPPRFIRIDYIDFTAQGSNAWNQLKNVLVGNEIESSSLSQSPSQPTNAVARPTWLSMKWILIGGAASVTSCVALLVIIGLVSGNLEGTNSGSDSSTSVDNAERFLNAFWTGNIDTALNYVCRQQQASYRTAFDNIVFGLTSNGIGVEARGIACESQSSSSLFCSYTLYYSNGLNEPVGFNLQMEDDLVCDPQAF
jgi:hypothetical protein